MPKRAAQKDRTRSEACNTPTERPKKTGKKKLPGRRLFDLSANEIEVIIKACTKYRHLMPTYLASMQEEIGLIDRILEKLSKADERN
jgi:glutamate racemase